MRNFKQKIISIIMTLIMIVGIVGTNITSVFAEENNKSINVNIAVVGMYNEILFKPEKIKVSYEGEKVTAEDALKAIGLKLDINDKGMVTSISGQKNGTDDGIYGSQSGWMYKVNFTVPKEYPKNQSVKDGDYLLFVYAKDYSDLLPSYDLSQNDFINVTVKNTEKNNSFSEQVTVLKGKSANAAIIEALKKHGGDFDKTSLSAGMLMTKDQTYPWGYIINGDKSTYDSKDIELKSGDTVRTFKDSGEVPKDDEVKEEPNVDVKAVKVNLNITGYKGIILDEKDLEVKDGETVINTLTRVLDSKNIKYTNSNGYISMIADQEEKERGIYSGWKYSVNSEFPNVGMGAYTPKQGDKINLIFVEGFNDETGFRDIDKIHLNKTELNLNVNGEETLVGNVAPKEATEKIEWTSSDKTIATVDENGKVTAVKEGKATITSTAKYNKEVKSECKVNVGINKPVDPKDYTNSINTLINNISEKISTGDWAALDLNKAGKEVSKDYLTKLEASIKKAEGKLKAATDYERTVLGILGAGGDPTNFAGYNLVEKIYNAQDINAPNAYIFGLIALDAGNFTIPDGSKWNRESLVKAILKCKTDDGGWSFGGGAADPDMTAMALSALAPYCEKDVDVKAAVNTAIEKLSQLQTDKGGFESWGRENSNSAAMTIIGLCDNGVDPTTDNRFIKKGNNVMDSLLSYAVSDNSGFGFTDNESVNELANEQGFRALAAYKLFKEGKGSVYKGFKGNEPEIKPEKKLIEITNLTKDTVFNLGNDAKVTINAVNKSDKDEDVSLIVALYDKADKFVNYVCATQTIKKGDASVLTSMMNLPKEGAYKLKAFIWDSIENMNPLSNIIEIPVK